MSIKRSELIDLESLGIKFETEIETNAFADLINEELESRVGNEIANSLTSDQLAEFDLSTSRKDSKRWLEKNCPDYKDIVLQIYQDLESEIIEYKYMIAGIIPDNDSLFALEDILENPLFDDDFEELIDDMPAE